MNKVGDDEFGEIWNSSRIEPRRDCGDRKQQKIVINYFDFKINKIFILK